MLNYDFFRVSIPHDMMPGETVELPLRFVAPEAPGPYDLQFDMVAGWVCWFEQLDNPVETEKLQVKRADSDGR